MTTLNDTRRTWAERLASGEAYDPLTDREEYRFVHPGTLPGLPSVDPGSLFYSPCHRPGEVRISGDGRTWLREAFYIAIGNDRSGRAMLHASPERVLIEAVHDALCRATLPADQWPALVGMVLLMAEEQRGGLGYLAEWITTAVASAMGVTVAALRERAIAEATTLRQAHPLRWAVR